MCSKNITYISFYFFTSDTEVYVRETHRCKNESKSKSKYFRTKVLFHIDNSEGAKIFIHSFSPDPTQHESANIDSIRIALPSNFYRSL